MGWETRDTDGATSGDTRYEWKRFETRSLARGKGQSQQFTRNATTGIPEASKLPSKRPRRPIEAVDPPRRRGGLKPNARKVNQASPTNQVIGSRRDCFWRVGPFEIVVYGLGDVLQVVHLVTVVPARSGSTEVTRERASTVRSS